ncbi:MAG TPA: hypothetical protein VJT14_14755 [Candidatus Dormibacteraeota bacterium]|nr:hypothetical protein [Candidatus Dormibacteraeota bacterium]
MVPLDCCPYERPFEIGFADCPGYEPEVFEPTTSRGKPLPAILICGNLTTGAHGGHAEHRYGRCRLGDAAARREKIRSQLIAIRWLR